MKLNLSQDDIKFLQEVQEELKTQDNRSTNNPIFCIQDEEEYLASDDSCSKYQWYNQEEGEVVADNDDELFDYLIEYDYEQHLRDYLCDGECKIQLDKLKELFKENLSVYCVDLYRYNLEHIIKISISTKEVISKTGPFSFFDSDAKEHLKRNSYHYTDKAVTYACSLWRSPRMEKLRDLLLNLEFTEGEYHENI